MLKIKNINHNFKNNKLDIPALQNVNLNIKNKEFVSIIGPSGCGKTTLLNIIAGYIKPLEGRITIQEKEVLQPGRDRIVINQENDLFDWMTIIQNIKFGLQNEKENMDHLVNLVNLQGFENVYPIQLSGGMKKRASLARAMAINPNLILMDEPFGSLDYQTKENLQIELLKIWEATNKTIVLVTHDIEEAVFLSNKIIVLSERPATVKKIIDIPFEYPREVNIKSDSGFINIKNEVRSLLVNTTA